MPDNAGSLFVYFTPSAEDARRVFELLDKLAELSSEKDKAFASGLVERITNILQRNVDSRPKKVAKRDKIHVQTATRAAFLLLCKQYDQMGEQLKCLCDPLHELTKESENEGPKAG